jgi:hypothetical protein
LRWLLPSTTSYDLDVTFPRQTFAIVEVCVLCVSSSLSQHNLTVADLM